MVIDKSDAFRDAMEYCGRKELKILEVELYEHGMQRHGRAFPGTRVAAQYNNLITLLRTVRTQGNPLDRKYYADALKYYGLEESKMDPTKKTLIVRSGHETFLTTAKTFYCKTIRPIITFLFLLCGVGVLYPPSWLSRRVRYSTLRVTLFHQGTWIPSARTEHEYLLSLCVRGG